MVAIEVELLTGRYVASQFNDRSRSEWPPHPARMFFALVDAWADADDPDPAERSALVWLEEAGAPSITCSPDEETVQRVAVTHYVPVNDPSAVRDYAGRYGRLTATVAAARQAENDPGLSAAAVTRAERAVKTAWAKERGESAKAAAAGGAPTSVLDVLPEQRGKQPRTFPTVIPASPIVVFTWSAHPGLEEHGAALERVVARVGRLGHSSTLVACRLVEDPPAPTFVPDPAGPATLRVPGPGQLAALERHFARHGGTEPRQLPTVHATYGPARPVAAARVEPPAPIFGDDWLVYALTGGPRLSVTDGLALARLARAALLAHAEHPIPEVLSGHVPGPAGVNTPPTTRPHVTLVPLASAGYPHSDFLLKGLAVVLPTELAGEEREAVFGALRRWRQAGGDDGAVLAPDGDPDRRWSLVRADASDAPATLRASRWCRASTDWMTVTPIVLDWPVAELGDRRPQRREKAERRAVGLIARACTHIGLPEPVDVRIRLDPMLPGGPRLREFPPYLPDKQGRPRPLVHALLRFDEPVRGPLLLGAGRFFGQGLCMPLPPGATGLDHEYTRP